MLVEGREEEQAVAGLSDQPLAGLSAWPERGGRWIFLKGVPVSGQAALAGAVEATLLAAGLRVVAVPEVPPGFATFAGARRLLAWLRPMLEREAPDLLDDARRHLGGLLEHDAGDGSELQRVAETIVFAITRRISRESHHSSIEIDALASLLLEAVRRCPSLQPGMALVIGDIERWDRPSLRCLHRLLQLATPADRLLIMTVTGDWEANGERPTDLQGWVTHARSRFFARLAAQGDFSVHRVGPGTAGPPRWSLGPTGGASDRDLLIEVGAALGYQNYERVHLLCEALLERATDDDQRAQAHRLVGVAHAQTGEIEASEAELTLALEYSADPPFRAHLEYLRGLLSTKRLYDLDRATDHYQRGERILDAWGVTSDQERIERAWLWNGEALVHTLKAKQMPPGVDREALYRESFRLELKAYELVHKMKSPAASYLRHNLLANITFLLEISHRFAEAVEFWTRAFERFLAADSTAFAAAFDGRLGALLYKAGRGEEAIEVLERACAFCHSEGDLFYEERTCQAFGYVAYHTGAHEQALAAFGAGVRLAIRLRDETAFRGHVAGILWTLAASEDTGAFERAVVAARRARPTSELAESLAAAVRAGHCPRVALEQAKVEIPPPSPKMPAYVPSIDLEGAPLRDMNRYLVFGSGPLREPA